MPATKYRTPPFTADTLKHIWGWPMRFHDEFRGRWKTTAPHCFRNWRVDCGPTTYFGIEALNLGIYSSTRTDFELRLALKHVHPGKARPHVPYFNQLKLFFLGPRFVIDSYEEVRQRKESDTSTEVYRARWILPGMSVVDLIVTHGIRNDPASGQPTNACIQIRYDPTTYFANTRRPPIDAHEKLLAKHLGDGSHTAIKKYQFPMGTYEGLEPFTWRGFIDVDELKRGNSDLLDHRVRQMSIIKPGFLQTPFCIQTQLAENEVAFYTVPELVKLYISNHWDTVCLELKNETSPVLLVDTSSADPNRCGSHLRLKGMDIFVKDPGSALLAKIAIEIATLTGIAIQLIKAEDMTKIIASHKVVVTANDGTSAQLPNSVPT